MKSKRRFLIIFWATLTVFYLGLILRYTIADGPSNIVYHGKEVGGIWLLFANLILSPLVSALLASMCVIPEFISEEIRKKKNHQPAEKSISLEPRG